MCPDIQENLIARQAARLAILRSHLHRFGLHKARLTKDQLSAAGSIAIQVEIDEILDHMAFASPHASHIDGYGSRCGSKFGRTSNQLHDLGAVNDVLTRQAGDVRTGPTDQSTLDYGGTPAGFRHRPGQVLARLPATDDQDVKSFSVGH